MEDKKKPGRQKGCIPWNKGIDCPQNGRKGRIFSQEWRNKISISAKKRVGILASNWKGGIVYTRNCLFCKKQFSVPIYRKDVTKFCSIRCHNINNSQHMSDEQKKKMSLAAKGKLKPWAKQNIKIAFQAQQNMKGSTSIEKKVYEELKNKGLLFEKQKLINGKFLVDAYIPSLNLVIEADGDYWHSLESNIKRDKAKNAYLIKCGFNLLRLTETEINKDVKIALKDIN